MTLPKKVAIAVTSYVGPLYPDGANTGAFYSEVYDPFKQFTDAGFEVDIISETGTFGWDQLSLDPSFAPAEIKAASEDPSNPFAKAIANVKKASSVDPSEYGIFNAAGGHGTIFDFVGKAPGVASVAEKVWSNGGIVTAVCHGPCLLADVKDAKSGSSIAKGRKVTGFSDDGEKVMKLTGVLDSRDLAYTSNMIRSAGAEYQLCEPPFEAKVVIDGRLVSGANPASATPAAKAALEAFKSL